MKAAGVTLAALVIILFAGLRFVHLEADFPPGVSGSGDLYTDEGAYSSAAVRWVTTGQWRLEGDFNPAVNLPVYPLIQAVTFKALGLSLGHARLTSVILYLLLMAAVWALARRWAGPVTALIALLVMAVNFNAFAFSRLALLEVPMTLFVVLGLLAAARGGATGTVLAAAAFLLALLTKTAAGFALPVILLVLLWRPEPLTRRLAQAGLFCALTGLGLLAYYFVLVRGHLPDYQTYFMTNVLLRTQGGLWDLGRALVRIIWYGRQFDPVLYPLALLGAAGVLVVGGKLRRHPLFWISVVWIAAYLATLATQNYAPARFYLVLAAPVGLLLGLMIEHLARSGRRGAAGLLAGVVILALAVSGGRAVDYLRHPQYSWASMMRELHGLVRQDGRENPVILGHFANSLSLGTGLLSLNDHYTWKSSLPARLERYRPDYYVTLGGIEAPIRSVLERYGTVEPVRTWDVFHNYYTGEPVALYRLTRKSPLEASRP